MLHRTVYFTQRTVTVVRSKNGERRTIPINETILSILRQKNKVRSVKTDLVFCGQALTPMEGDHLRCSFRLTIKKAEITAFHFHDLRHTFAKRLVQAGIDIYKVQRLLGHKRRS